MFLELRYKPLGIGEFVSPILRTTYRMYLNPSNQTGLCITMGKIRNQKGDWVSMLSEQTFPGKQSLVEEPAQL